MFIAWGHLRSSGAGLVQCIRRAVYPPQRQPVKITVEAYWPPRGCPGGGRPAGGGAASRNRLLTHERHISVSFHTRAVLPPCEILI